MSIPSSFIDRLITSVNIVDIIGRRLQRDSASREDCLIAAKAAAADIFISNLENGYDTKIDPSKIKFSGGEQQRLSIARAILRDAPILLLDEPTSALDAQSENQIRKALKNLKKQNNSYCRAEYALLYGSCRKSNYY